jgi:transcriptional regulator with XRE-family HTH domain
MKRPPSFSQDASQIQVGQALRSIRVGLGISCREVERRAARYAESAGDDRYNISHSWLVHIENSKAIPSIHAIITLGMIYDVDQTSIFELFDAPLRRPILAAHMAYEPRRAIVECVGRQPWRGIAELNRAFDRDRSTLVRELGEMFAPIPEQLLSIQREFSAPYAYLGADLEGVPPPIGKMALVALNTKERNIVVPSGSSVECPVYLLQTRDGYACGWCERQLGSIILVPYPCSGVQPHKLLTADADVLGRVTSVLVRLGPSRRRPRARLWEAPRRVTAQAREGEREL